MIFFTKIDEEIFLAVKGRDVKGGGRSNFYSSKSWLFPIQFKPKYVENEPFHSFNEHFENKIKIDEKREFFKKISVRMRAI